MKFNGVIYQIFQTFILMRIINGGAFPTRVASSNTQDRNLLNSNYVSILEYYYRSNNIFKFVKITLVPNSMTFIYVDINPYYTFQHNLIAAYFPLEQNNKSSTPVILDKISFESWQFNGLYAYYNNYVAILNYKWSYPQNQLDNYMTIYLFDMSLNKFTIVANYAIDLTLINYKNYVILSMHYDPSKYQIFLTARL